MRVLSCNHPLEIAHTDRIDRIQHYRDFLGNMYCFQSQPAAIVCAWVDRLKGRKEKSRNCQWSAKDTSSHLLMNKLIQNHLEWLFLLTFAPQARIILFNLQVIYCHCYCLMFIYLNMPILQKSIAVNSSEVQKSLLESSFTCILGFSYGKHFESLTQRPGLLSFFFFFLVQCNI